MPVMRMGRRNCRMPSSNGSCLQDAQHIAVSPKGSARSASVPICRWWSRSIARANSPPTKGTGFTPIDEQIDYYITLLDDCLERCRGRPWKETLEERIAVIRRFYEHVEHIDLRRLGLLEIFQGQTYRNLRADPRITLHYTGDGPDYPSYQINALAEIVGPEDKRFQFIYLAR